MCRFGQIDIVERINGHATKATVRLLRKIKIDEGTLGELGNILRAISDPRIVSVAAHRQHASVRFLALLGNYPDLTDPVPANVLARILDSGTGQGPGVAAEIAGAALRPSTTAAAGKAVPDCIQTGSTFRSIPLWL